MQKSDYSEWKPPGASNTISDKITNLEQGVWAELKVTDVDGAETVWEIKLDLVEYSQIKKHDCIYVGKWLMNGCQFQCNTLKTIKEKAITFKKLRKTVKNCKKVVDKWFYTW